MQFLGGGAYRIIVIIIKSRLSFSTSIQNEAKKTLVGLQHD